MDPKNRRRKADPSAGEPQTDSNLHDSDQEEPRPFGEESEEDRQKSLADAELKNLWDATEVIDMDTW
jgi:hypothetical protein